MKRKRILLGLLSLACIVVGMLGFAGCKGGEKGDKGDKGAQGAQGVGIESITFDEDGNFVITFSDGTTQTVQKPNLDIHIYGAWTSYGVGENQPCEERMFYRVCAICNEVDWREGTANDHVWDTVTTLPTCQTEGYDTHTCTICGKVEVDNYQETVDHAWSEVYSHDNTYHWYDCETCIETKDKGEHTPDGTGVCTACNVLAGATEGVLYDLSADETYAIVIGYEGVAKRVRIADTYNGAPVKEIYNNAFEGADITEVAIPNSITKIGDRAFANSDLRNVVIPDSVTELGREAFASCSLWSVSIGEGLRTISTYAFENCGSLENIVFGSNVTTIGGGAFEGCYGLASIDIPSSVTTIEGSAFRQCYGLASVSMSDNVTVIGQEAFSQCSRLTSIVLSKNVTYMDGSIFNFCDSLQFNKYENCNYLGCRDNPYFALVKATNTNYSNYTIHEDTKIIVGGAFMDCTRMLSITIPDGVVSIGQQAFEDCDGLTSVIIPKSVMEVGYGIFIFTEVDIYCEATSQPSGWHAEWDRADHGYGVHARYWYSEDEPTEVWICWHYNDAGEAVIWK